tara:strand:+ start:912 stop:1427 length:516 start_codon:yes stop_codon:yes gene_type:complete
MERRINYKIGLYIRQLKEDFKSKLSNVEMEEEKMYELLNFIYTYKHLEIDKNDLQKRKRVKNVVPFCDRCKAKRANGEQCSRRSKDDSKFCGTHIKGIPHGQIEENGNNIEDTRRKVTVWAEEIMGITYYIDKNNNVYSPSDIINNIDNPNVIAKWEMEGDKYIIPSLFSK